MKRLVLSTEDLLNMPTPESSARFYMQNKLRSSGFDLDKPIESYHDVVNNEYVYSQKEDDENAGTV